MLMFQEVHHGSDRAKQFKKWEKLALLFQKESYCSAGRLFVAFPRFQKKSWMTETMDRDAMTIHRVELAMITIRKSGNVIEKDAGVEGGLRF